MDLEHLTKHQIILLTLLVSFVTSIATGIVTVSLMDYAPPTVMKTVNQIVERTVEVVVPEEKEENVAVASVAEATSVEKIVFVENDTNLSSAIASVSDGLLRIYSIPTTPNEESVFLGYGAVIGPDSVVVTKKVVATSDVVAIDMKGETYELAKIHTGATFSYYSFGENTALTPFQASDEGVALGGSLYSVWGEESLSLQKGIFMGADTETGAIQVDFDTSIKGLPVFSGNGKLIGLVGQQGESEVVISVAEIESVIADLIHKE